MCVSSDRISVAVHFDVYAVDSYLVACFISAEQRPCTLIPWHDVHARTEESKALQTRRHLANIQLSSVGALVAPLDTY